MRVKKIHGFDHYFIDEYGNIYSDFIKGKLRVKKHGMVKGYPKAVLAKRGCRQVTAYVHRLVLETFVGPCPDGMVACHNDGNPLNNYVGNLRWDTHENNCRDKRKHGTENHGEKNGMAKYTDAVARKVKRMKKKGMTYGGISEKLGIPVPSVSTMVNRWKHLDT